MTLTLSVMTGSKLLLVSADLRRHLSFALILFSCVEARGAVLQSNGYGPEVTAFVEFLRHEESELEFQIKHKEISKKEYVRSKTRISIHRDTVLRIVKQTGEDNVPELHVVVFSELDQLIENGTRAIRGLKPGALINGKWRLVASVTRGELFYVFERLTIK